MEWLAEWGYVGLFMASFLAATVVPIGSETVVSLMLLGDYEFMWVIVVASLGNWLGGMSGYYLGYQGKWEWISRYLRISRDKVERFSGRIQQYGALLALITWLPGIGDFLAIGLGLFKVNWKRVAIFMLLGKFLRFLFWAWVTVFVLQHVK